MYNQLENSKDNKSIIPANSVIQNKNNGKNSQVIADNRPKSVLQRKIGDSISNNKNVIQLADHPKKASGTGMERKDPGHGKVKSKQHAAARAKKDGKREAKRAALRERLQAKRAAEADE